MVFGMITAIREKRRVILNGKMTALHYPELLGKRIAPFSRKNWEGLSLPTG